MNGSQLLDFNDATNGLNTCNLPTGQDYNGAPAQYCQNVEYDETGKLLFFVVDGNIYDNAGYMMADNGANHNGDWSKLEPNEVAVLDQHAHEGGAGAAMANGILFSNRFTDYLPEVQFPREGPEQRLVPVKASNTIARPALALYPNPANTEAYLKWPVGLKGGLIQIMDAQGRILLEHQAVENGLSRLNLGELPAGLYKVYLEGTELSASFSIAR